MSSSVASAGEQNAQQNFNPSWMRSTFQGGGANAINSSPRVSIDEQEEYPVSDPVYAKFRYERDELLALMPKDSTPPDGLRDCPFFTEIAQEPVVKDPLSEREERCQSNINSSKAMFLLSHSERTSVTAGGAFGSGYSSGGANGSSPSSKNGDWTPVKSKSNSHTPERGGHRGSRGGFFSRGFGRGGFSLNENGHDSSSAPSTPGDSSASPGSKYNGRGRGGGFSSVGRGGSTTAMNYNSRADALYDRPKPSKSVENNEDEDSKRDQSEAASRVWNRADSWGPKADTNAWNKDKNEKIPNVWKDRSSMVNSVKNDGTEFDVSENMSASKSNSSDGNCQSSDLNTVSSSTSNMHNDSLNGAISQAATWPTSVPVSSTMSDIMGIDHLRMLQLKQHQQFLAQITAQQAAMAAAAANTKPVEFYYIDPSETKRGPFSKEQMNAWFKAGYFNEESLKIHRGESSEYKTIGELLKENGATTPFDYPEDKNELRMPTIPKTIDPFTHQTDPSLLGLFGNQNVWHPTVGMDSLRMFGMMPTLEQQFAAEQQRLLEQHTHRLKEETEKYREMQEEIVRSMQRQQELTKQQLQEQKDALLRHREELHRRENEMKEKALEIQKQLENEKLQLEEKRKLIEIENAKKLEEEKRRQQIEEARRNEEELLWQITMEKNKKKAEEEAEKERKRLRAEAEAAAQLLKQKKAQEERLKQEKKEAEERAKKEAEERAKKEADAKKKSWNVETVKPKISPSLSEESDDWTPVNEPPKQPKMAPWASVENTEKVSSVEKTLREIQLEEEKKFKAEKEKLEKQKKEEAQKLSLQASGTWGNASSRLQWNKGQSAWGPVPAEANRPMISPLLDGPPLEEANKKVKPQVKATAPVKTTPPPAPKTAAKNSPQVKKAAEKKPKQDTLLPWFEKRFKSLKLGNEEIDVNMLYSFVMDLENPNEVEDIVMSYLDESKQVKEFVREFLKRRLEMRSAANSKANYDDLTSARTVAAAVSDNSGSNNSGQGKKKKKVGSKSQKMVLDGTILGFRAAASSDRLNKGEIDAIPSTPINPSRR